MVSENEREYRCKSCGKEISKRAASTYNGFLKKCYQREEKEGEGLY